MGLKAPWSKAIGATHLTQTIVSHKIVRSHTLFKVEPKCTKLRTWTESVLGPKCSVLFGGLVRATKCPETLRNPGLKCRPIRLRTKQQSDTIQSTGSDQLGDSIGNVLYLYIYGGPSSYDFVLHH